MQSNDFPIENNNNIANNPNKSNKFPYNNQKKNYILPSNYLEKLFPTFILLYFCIIITREREK